MKRQIPLALFLIPILLAALGTGCSKKEEQAATAESAAADVSATPEIKPGEMVLIPAGEFILGSDKEETTKPEQKMFLPAFYIDKYEVTMGEFLRFAVETGYQSQGDWRSLWSPDKANKPVVNITFADAIAYAKWAGKRLPTEFEWEKAARGPNGFRYPWGNDWEPGRANTYESGIKQPAEVGSYAGDVSPFGVYDMLGNVKEWTDSHFQPYKGSTLKHKDFGENFHILRGIDYAYYGGPVKGQGQFHLAIRSYYLPDAHFNFGFRCAKDAPADAQK